MKVTELPAEVQERISHITNWDTLISDDVAGILGKLASGEELTRGENGLEVTPSELAAIWSVINGDAIKVDHVRQVKREGRIQASKSWGTGPGARSLYKVREVKGVKVSHQRGRPRKHPKNEAIGA